ncbi:alcohol dehydrogenase catalytic domain-containing protein [Patescibacteria group bacterium]
MKVNTYLKPSSNKPIEYGHVELNPKSTDIVIKTKHAGLSKGDVNILENKWNATIYPAIGTSETVGVVEDVGDE